MGLPGFDPGWLLEWMTHHHLPLALYREADEDGCTGSWVVVDNSTDTVKGSGESAFAALSEARRRETD